MGETEKSTSRNAPLDDLSSSAAERIEGKRGRGRPRKDAAASTAVFENVTGDSGIRADLERIKRLCETLYDPKNLRTMVNAYPSYFRYKTGHEHWKWSDEKVDSCAKPLAVLLEIWTQTDPKWMALAIFAANFGAAIGEGHMLDAAIARRDRAVLATRGENDGGSPH